MGVLGRSNQGSSGIGCPREPLDERGGGDRGEQWLSRGGKMGFYPINHGALEEGDLLEVGGDLGQLW